jgi:Ca2+-binding RTX toxin-like protein
LRISARLAFLALVGAAVVLGLLIGPNGALNPAPRTVLAANVDIVLNGDPDDSIALGFVGAGCPAVMAAGDTCKATVSVSNNTSPLAIDYAAAASVTAGAECDPGNPGPEFVADINNFVDTTDHPGVDDTRHMPAGSTDTETFDVLVTLDLEAGNPCQAATATVSLTVNATEDLVDPVNGTDLHTSVTTCAGPFDFTIVGTSGADNLVGNPTGRNHIIGNGGNDKVTGGSNADCIETGSGNDHIIGGGGNDEIRAGAGNNHVTAGDGNDRVTVTTGNDHIDLGNGNDFVDADRGNNQVYGGPGIDRIIVNLGNDNIDGGDGTDVIEAGNGNNNVTGGAQDDDITTGVGNDVLRGGTGFDACRPGTGNNNVSECETN